MNMECMTIAEMDAYNAGLEEAAKLVIAGGDSVDRLETAITHGPNAAIAEAILAKKLVALKPLSETAGDEPKIESNR